MAKILDKKEQVIDFQLSPYGKHLLSVGNFQPVYYSFLDDNILYDAQSAGIQEPQNNIKKRIKEESSYLETMINYGDPSERTHTLEFDDDEALTFYSHQRTPSAKLPQENLRKNIKAIGDAFLESQNKNSHPAWKVAMLQSEISASTQADERNSIEIPQIYITASYTKKVVPAGWDPDPKNVRNLFNRIGPFSDDTVIELIMNDPIVYMEEVNTQLLNHNFEVEIFCVKKDQPTSNAVSGGLQDTFERKYFPNKDSQVVNGFMVKEKVSKYAPTSMDSPFPAAANFNNTIDDVSYYFDIVVDQNVNPQLACKGISVFDKTSYYIDLDFDCTDEDDEDIIVFADIYGVTTEPGLCL